MTGRLERVRAAVASRVVRQRTLGELAERIDELAAGAEENSRLAVGLERHLDALEAEVAQVVAARQG